MMNRSIVILLNCLLSCWLHIAQAEERPPSNAIDVGQTLYGSEHTIAGYRVGIQRRFSDSLQFRGVPLNGYFESSLNYWKGVNGEIYALTFAPVLTRELCRRCSYRPYLEGGVGVALLSATTIDSINLSSRFQFEVRAGMGMQLDNLGLHMRFMHYSNGYIVRPNHGIDLFVAGASFNF